MAQVTVECSARWGMCQKRKGFKMPIKESISRNKISKDPRLANQKVREEIHIDRINNQYDHVVTDQKTGEAQHEEHEPLTKHNKKEKQAIT